MWPIKDRKAKEEVTSGVSAGIIFQGQTLGCSGSVYTPGIGSSLSSLLHTDLRTSSSPVGWMTQECVLRWFLDSPAGLTPGPHIGGQLGNAPLSALLPASLPPSLPASPSPATSTPHGNPP